MMPNPHSSSSTHTTPTHRPSSLMSGTDSLGGNGGSGGGQSTAASKRREANRLAAARFRTRKKDQVVDLEGRVAGLEAENVALRGEVRNLRGQLGIKLDTPIPIGLGGGMVGMGLNDRVGTPGLGGQGSGADSPGMGSSLSLNSLAGGEDEEDDDLLNEGTTRGSEMGVSGSTAKKRRKMGLDGGNVEDENVQLRERLRGYQATLRVMQEEIAMLKGKSVPPSGLKGGRTPSFNLDPSLADMKPSSYNSYRSPSSRTPSGSSSRHHLNHLVESGTDSNDDTMAAQGLASLHHLPTPRPGYERGESGYLGTTGSSSHLSLPPLSPVLRIDSASPGREYEQEGGRAGYGNPTGPTLMGRSIHGLPGSRPHSPSTLSAGGLPLPGRPTSPMSIERLSSPSPLGASSRTLNALQNAAFAVGLQISTSAGNSSPLGASGAGNGSSVTGGRESPLGRNRSWGLGGSTPSGLGLASLPHSRAGSRGLDSPISAERSGANEDDDSPESGGYAQDYFGRYQPGSGSGAGSGAGGGGTGVGSRLKLEREFSQDKGDEEGEDEITPPATSLVGVVKKENIDPALQEAMGTGVGDEEGEVNEMQVDPRD